MASKNNEELFRKKSLEKVKSPENLDDYIQVSNPGVWLLLVSVIVLLAGVCVWGIFGHIDSTVETSVHTENGAVSCYIEEASAASVQTGMTVRFGNYEAVITEIRSLDMLGYSCTLQPEQTVPDGFYEGKVIVESYKPLSFVLN